MTSIAMPAIGMGTFRLHGDTARDAVKSALILGYRHIDTAQFYDNETSVGDGIKASAVARKDIFLTTKVWFDRLRHDDLITSLKDSLQRLQTDQVNLALIHWPSPNDEVPMDEYLGALREAQRQGLTEHIGVSNFTCTQMDEAVKILGKGALLTNQVEVHPFMANSRVVEHARELGLKATGYMPLAVGQVMENATLKQIADAHAANAAQIAIAWSAARGVVPIPSSTNPQHQKANLDAMGITLSEDELLAISELDRGERLANPDIAPNWDE